jgi:hypothetical protein
MKTGSRFVLAFALAAPRLLAQATDTPEPGSREAIAAATTEPRFQSPWTSYVPDHPTIPSPTKFLGHVVGAPGELTRTDKLYGYYRALAAASPRVQVEVIGKSEEGRDMLLVVVGDDAALKELDRYRKDMADLSDPRRCDESCLEQRVTAPGARVFYMLHGGLHSTETGSSEMLMELAHRLAVSEVPHVREIRDRLVVLINPVAEPDGRDRMVDWFYRHLKGKTDYENLPPVSPPYGASTSATTTTAMASSASSRSRARPRTPTSSGCRSSCTTCTSRCRCSRSGPAPAPTTPTSTRAFTASGTRSRSRRSRRSRRWACRASGPTASARASRRSTRTRPRSTTTA